MSGAIEAAEAAMKEYADRIRPSGLTRRLAEYMAVVGIKAYDAEQQWYPTKEFVCGARKQGSAGGNDPPDCNWPVCGCDPYAGKVIAALEESGLLSHPVTGRHSGVAE